MKNSQVRMKYIDKLSSENNIMKHRFTFCHDDSTKNQLEELSKLTGSTSSEVVRLAIDNLYNSNWVNNIRDLKVKIEVIEDQISNDYRLYDELTKLNNLKTLLETLIER